MPSPVVEFSNRAVAVAMAEGPRGWASAWSMRSPGSLRSAGYYLLPGVRGDLLQRSSVRHAEGEGRARRGPPRSPRTGRPQSESPSPQARRRNAARRGARRVIERRTSTLPRDFLLRHRGRPRLTRAARRDAAMMKRIAAVEDDLARQGRPGPVARPDAGAARPRRSARTNGASPATTLRRDQGAAPRLLQSSSAATEEEAIDAAEAFGKATGSDGTYEISTDPATSCYAPTGAVRIQIGGTAARRAKTRQGPCCSIQNLGAPLASLAPWRLVRRLLDRAVAARKALAARAAAIATTTMRSAWRPTSLSGPWLWVVEVAARADGERDPEASAASLEDPGDDHRQERELMSKKGDVGE